VPEQEKLAGSRHVTITASLFLSHNVHRILHPPSARIQAVRPPTTSQPDPRVLASNRDEYLDRPATPAKWHDFGNTSSDESNDDAWVLSGRDSSSSSGGTWLGMTSDLRIGVMFVYPVPTCPKPIADEPEPIFDILINRLLAILHLEVSFSRAT
jgi:hypothetical protein